MTEERIHNARPWAAPYAEEFRALARERDPEMYAEGMLHLGQRLEAGNRLEEAVRVFAEIMQGEGDAAIANIRQRAQARLDAITGTGSPVLRAEFLLRRLARETMEPSTLVGLTAASAAFRMTRLASLSRLLGSPNANFATRGFGARATAGLLGFGVEASVFPLASRGAAATLGRDLDWSLHQVGREIAGSFIVLGAMKLTGWGASALANRNGFLQQTGMFAGILLGHHLETSVGLRPHVDGATSFVDSLAMLVQFNVAGRLAHGVMGEGFRAWELAQDHQAHTLSLRGPEGRSNLFATGEKVAGRLLRRFAPRNDRLAFPSPIAEGSDPVPSPISPPILMMTAGKGANASERPSSAPIFSFQPRDQRASAVDYDVGTKRLLSKVQRELEPISKGSFSPENAARSAAAENAVQKVAIFQMLDFAKKLNAEVREYPSERLIAPFEGDSIALGDGILREAKRLTGYAPLPGWMKRVWEVRIPYQDVRFGSPKKNGRFIMLANLVNNIESSLSRRVRLLEMRPEAMTVRFLAPAWLGRLLAAERGEGATRPIYVWGDIPRDLMMGYRENRDSPLGITRNPIWVEEFEGWIPPWILTLHDAFHQGIADRHSPAMARSAGHWYRLAKDHLLAFPFIETHLNRLSDLDPGSEWNGKPESFFRFTLEGVFDAMIQDAEQSRLDPQKLMYYADYLKIHRKMLEIHFPEEPEPRFFHQVMLGQIAEMQGDFTKLLHRMIRDAAAVPPR